MTAAFNSWPETADFQPVDAEHLRKWITVKLGHFTATTIDINGMTPDQAIAAVAGAVAAAGPYAFVRPCGTRLRVFTPGSIAFDKLDQAEALAVFDRAAAIIRDVTGIDFDAPHLAAHAPDRGGWRDALDHRAAAVAA